MNRRNVQEPIQAFRKSTQLAIDSIEEIVKIGSAIIEGKTRKDRDAAQFCSILRNILLSINTWLKDQENHGKTPQKRVERLLNNLERLCTWTQHGRTRDWLTLRGLKTTPAMRKTANASLQHLGARKEFENNRIELIEKLRGFSATDINNETAAVMRTSQKLLNQQRPTQRSSDFDDDIQHLYKIIQQYRFCERQRPDCEIIANIKLNGYKTLVAGNSDTEFLANDASSEFGVLFLDHPHERNSSWQETRIQTCSQKPSKTSVVSFASVPSQARLQQELLHPDNFCQRISARGQDMLCLSTRLDKLVYHKSNDTSRTWLANLETISLASMLGHHKVTWSSKSKAILGKLLAMATWQFYDSDIIGQGLTNDRIHFLGEERDAEYGIFVDEPMLVITSAKTESHATNKTQDNKNTSFGEMIHENPKILALGILLLEIETGKTMKQHREDKRICPPGPFNINTDYKIARKLASTGPNAHRQSIMFDMVQTSPLIKTLPLCVQSEELSGKVREDLSAQKIKTTPTSSSEKNMLRSVIYRDIVEPLKYWADQFEPTMKRLKPLYEVGGPSYAPIPPTPRTADQPPSHQPMNASDKRLRQESQRWFLEYERLTDILKPREGFVNQGYIRTKIAILDTGVSPDEFENQDTGQYLNPPRHVHYKDFVSLDDAKRDDTGHGSAGVFLLSKACPSADIYIARVIPKDTVTKDDVQRVVQGIDWAIENGVDIITMAIGFRSQQELVVDAVGRAHRKGILIFSAASNSGNVSSVYCPANVTDKVFGIYSTNGYVKPSEFNPAPLCPDSSFAIFGEAIELYEGHQLLKGTSYATSIAAGLAAALLDFVRQNLDRPEAAKLSRLRERPQLKRVFQEMSDPEAKLWCIRPWKIVEEIAALDRENQRSWILGTLVRLMSPNKLHELRR